MSTCISLTMIIAKYVSSNSYIQLTDDQDLVSEWTEQYRMPADTIILYYNIMSCDDLVEATITWFNMSASE